MSSSCPLSSSSSSSSKTEANKKAGFQRRQVTVMKKAQELSILCDIQVAVICYGPNKELQTWPTDMSKVREMAERYKKLSKTDKRKKSLNLQEFLDKIKVEDEKKENDLELVTDKLDGYTAEELSELLNFLDRKSNILQERLRFLNMNKRRALDPSEAEHDQSDALTIDQELYQHTVPVGSADTGLSLVPFEQQETESVRPLPAYLLDSSMNNFVHDPVPCYYDDYSSDFSPLPYPPMNQNFWANHPNGDWSPYNSELGGTQMSYQMNGSDQQAYQSGFNNDMMNNNNANNICLQSQYPWIQTAVPFQQFAPFPAWNPTPSAHVMPLQNRSLPSPFLLQFQGRL